MEASPKEKPKISIINPKLTNGHISNTIVKIVSINVTKINIGITIIIFFIRLLNLRLNLMNTISSSSSAYAGLLSYYYYGII